MSTNNSVNVPLSGSTGTVNFVGSTSPTLITPTLGVATATSLAFSPTTSGIIGTTAADNASSGKVGEVVSSQITAASAINITNNTPTNVTSISLTAGDWTIRGNVFYIPAATTTITEIVASLSTTSATLGTNIFFQAALTAGKNQGLTGNYLRVNVSGNQTVYLVGYTLFATSTMKVCGNIYARRLR